MTAKTDSGTIDESAATFLTRADVAALFTVSLRTVDGWRERGILVPSRIGGIARYRRDDVLALMNNPGTQ